MKKRAVSTPKNDSMAVKLLCFIPFLVLYVLQFLWFQVIGGFYRLMVKIPDFSSHILGAIRLAFWGSLLLALGNTNADSYPYVTLADQAFEFRQEYGFIYWAFQAFMVINLVVQLFVTCGFSYNASPSERAAYKTAFGMGAMKSSNNTSSAFGGNIAEGMSFFDSLLGQQSTRGKTEALSKFFGGNFK